MGNMHLICARHGETDHNLYKIVQGWAPTELNELGFRQAQEMVDKITDAPQAIFHSDLIRCKQTVTLLNDKFPNVPSFSDWRLRERSFGQLENVNASEVDWQQFDEILPHESPFDIEPMDLMKERVKSFMRDLAFFKISSAVIITHGGVLNQFKRILEPDKDHGHIHYKNAELIEFNYSFDDPNLKANEVSKWDPNNNKSHP